MSSQFTQRQLEFVLGVIGDKAWAAKQLANRAFESSDLSEEGIVNLEALETLVECIGVLAEHHANNSGCEYGGIEERIMHPAYREAAAKADVQAFGIGGDA